MAQRIRRPEPDEYAHFYRSYVAAVGDDALGALERQMEQLQLLLTISPAQAAHRYAAGKWSVREIVGHVADAERVFSYRLLRIARGDATPLPGFDENHYVAHGNADRRTLTDLVEELGAIRRSTLALVRSLDEGVWTNRGTMSGSPVTVRALVFVIAGHFAHHMNVLRERYGIPLP
jgi:hypothetical protein